jgi:hypothetical protein
MIYSCPRYITMWCSLKIQALLVAVLCATRIASEASKNRGAFICSLLQPRNAAWLRTRGYYAPSNSAETLFQQHTLISHKTCGFSSADVRTSNLRSPLLTNPDTTYIHISINVQLGPYNLHPLYVNSAISCRPAACRGRQHFHCFHTVCRTSICCLLPSALLITGFIYCVILFLS